MAEESKKPHELTLARQPGHGDPVGVEINSRNPSFGSSVRVSGGDTIRFTAGEDFSLAFPRDISDTSPHTPSDTGGQVFQGRKQNEFVVSVTIKDKRKLAANQPYYYYISMLETLPAKTDRAGNVVKPEEKRIWIQDPDSWVDDC